MEGLDDLLSRFKESLDKDTRLREIVTQIIKEELGFDLRLADILVKNNTLIIKTTPSKRSEIKLNEKKVLDLVRSKTKLNLKRITY